MVIISLGSDTITGGFMTGINQIWLDAVECNGTEKRLIDCPANSLESHNCGHSRDVGIRCEVPGKMAHECIV